MRFPKNIGDLLEKKRNQKESKTNNVRKTFCSIQSSVLSQYATHGLSQILYSISGIESQNSPFKEPFKLLYIYICI